MKITAIKPYAVWVGIRNQLVVKIEPDQVLPYEEVAAEIKQEIALARGRSELTEKHDKIEDERAGGDGRSQAAGGGNRQSREV